MQQQTYYLLQNKMKLKNSKKGSHIDVIVSFIIFIVFISFLFILLNPATIMDKDKEQTAEYLKLRIDEKIQTDLVVVHVANISNKDIEDCLRFDDENLEISGMTPIAKDSSGNSVDSTGSLDIDWNSASSFFRVYYSKDSFNLHTSDSAFSSCQTGEIKSVRYIQEAVETNISQLFLDFNANYSAVKSELGLAKNEEFAMQFQFSNGTTVGTAPTDAKIERYAEKYQITYFDMEANKRSGYMTIYIW
jgi:hypothetical protein